IPAFQESTFNKDTFALRDKVVLKFDRDKVDGVEVDAAGKTLVMAKDGADWKIRKPLETRADYGSVEGLIRRVQTVQMKSIAADPAPPTGTKKERQRESGSAGQHQRRQRARHAAHRREGDGHYRLRARRVEAGGRHGRKR